MSRIRIGQLGIGHNHAAEKMAALRKLSDLYEVVGVAEPDPQWRKRRGGLAAYDLDSALHPCPSLSEG